MENYKSLFDIWKKASKQYSELIAFSDYTEKTDITYKEAFRQVCFLAEKFKDYGLKRFEHVSLFAVNFPIWLILEQAIITLGAVCVSKTSDMNVSELEYVYNNSDSIALITDNINIINFFIEKDKNFVKTAKFIIYTGNEQTDNPNIINLNDILSELKEDTQIKTDWEENPDDTAYINYTSGTSSSPKGAMLPNKGMSYVVEELQKFNDIQTGKTFVVTFPLSSAGGKSFNLLCFSRGCKIVYTPYKEFYKVLEKYNPDYLHCAPKIIQTIHEKFMKIIGDKGFIWKQLFSFSYKISKNIVMFERKYLYKNKLLFLSEFISSIKKFLDKSFYREIRNKLLKDEAVVFIGSAHLAKPLEDFLQIMNIKHIQHYGLTETTGLDVSNTLESQKRHPYTVGLPFSKTTIEIINPDDYQQMKNGEIGLVTLKGPEILYGYYKNEEATKKALSNEHFLNTGDLGYIDNEGYLVILSRCDDVIVLSNGYNVYTPLLECETKDSEYIYQIAITGHGKPYLTALIVTKDDIYKNWCKTNNVKENDKNQNIKFKNFVINHLNEKIKRKKDFKYYEKIKDIYFLNNEFTVENGMLTATLKVKYKKVVNFYEKEINCLYKGI